MDLNYYYPIWNNIASSIQLEKVFEEELDSDSDLYDILRGIRNEIAQRRRRPPYTIFSNAVLARLADAAPVTREEAESLKGIGPKNSRDLPRFIEAINQWRSENF